MAWRLVLVFLAAFLLRSAHLLFLHESAAGSVLVQDARHYHEVALRLSAGEPATAGGPSFSNPGYPYVLAAVYTLLGPRPAAVLWLQALAGAASAVLLTLVGRQLFRNELAALAAGLLYAAYTGAVFYDGLLLTPSLVNFLLVVALLALTGVYGERGVSCSIVSGAVLGAASLLRPNALLFVAGAAFLIAWLPANPVASASRRERRLRALLFVVAAGAVVLPPVVIQAARHGAWVPISANAGINFWIGNNRHAEGIYRAAPFLEHVDMEGEHAGFIAEARRRSGRPELGLADVDRFWFREGLADVRAFPGRSLRIAGRKLALFSNAVEAKTNVGLGFHERLSPVLARATLGWSWIAVLAAAGAVFLVLERNRIALAWLGLLVIVPLLTCVGFFVSGEYRHPASLALCLAAAVPIARLATPSEVRWSRWLLAVLASALVALVVFHRFPPLERTVDPRLDFANHARAASQDSTGQATRPEDYDRARQILEEAGVSVARDPFLLDARLMVDCSEAFAFRRVDDIARAHATARLLQALQLRPSAELPAEFVEATQDSLRRCVALLPRLDPALRDPNPR